MRRPGRLQATTADAGVPLGLAVLWAVLGLTHPHTTYHFAPVLVVASSALLRRLRVGTALQAGRARRDVAWSGLLALVVTGVLGFTRSLDGPTLLNHGSALVETLVFLIFGGVGGYLAATRPRGRRRPHRL